LPDDEPVTTYAPPRPVVVVGAGHVGLVTAIAFAKVCEVRLVDLEESVLTALERGEPRIHEAGLRERLGEVAGSLKFERSLDEALHDKVPRLVFVAVGTPTLEESALDAQGVPHERITRAGGAPAYGVGEAADLRPVLRVIDELIGRRHMLAAIMKSTVPPGTGRVMVEHIRARDDGLRYISCPEFLQEGRAFADVDRPDRIVVGYEQSSWASEELRQLHEEVYPKLRQARSRLKYLTMDLTSAELVKHASNVHLAIRVSYANELAHLCELVDADALRVMDGVGADPRIGRDFLEPGVGFGGSCLGKDARALRWEAQANGLELKLASAALEVNEDQAVRMVDKLAAGVGGLDGARIALLGLTFKPDTDDIRDSPAFAVADLLCKHGAHVRAFDPMSRARAATRALWIGDDRQDGQPPRREVAISDLEALQDADAVIVVTGWPHFADIDWRAAREAMMGRLVIDGPNALVPERVLAAGLEYHGTGRGSGRSLSRGSGA
jgi:UDPglucose 6-dehydrogenase